MNKYEKAYKELIEFSYVEEWTCGAGCCSSYDDIQPLLEEEYENSRNLMRELKERATPMKVINQDYCPKCKKVMVINEFCCNCGQKLDWSD